MDTVRFGRSVRALRVRRRWRQEDLAAAADVSRGVIARIEQGRADRVTVETLERVLAPFGARLVCRVDWRGEGIDRLLDQAHAELVELTVRSLGGAGWLCATEVSFNNFGERGSVDILAYRPELRLVLVIEVKTIVADIQATLASLDRKARLGRELAASRGWDATHVARLLVIRGGSANRRRVSAVESTFASAFPLRGPAMTRWIDRPTPRSIAGLLFVDAGHSKGAATRVSRRLAGRPDPPDVPEPVP